MRIIPPNDLTLSSSNVTESAYPDWASGTSYTAGDRVYYVAVEPHRVYEAMTSTTGDVPPDSPTQWALVGPSNRWAMFDGRATTRTVKSGGIDVTIDVTGDRIALFDVEANDVDITSKDSAGNTLHTENFDLRADVIDDWFGYFFSPFEYRRNVIRQLAGDTSLDQTSNGNDGTLINGPTWVSDGPTADIQGALSFDGVDDYVETDSAIDLQQYTAYTLEFWVRSTDNSTFKYVFGESNDSTNVFVGLTTDGGEGHIRYRVRDDSLTEVADITGTATVFDGEWHHIAIVDNNGEAELFVDALSDGTSSYARTAITINNTAFAELLLGGGGGFQADAEIADARAWNTARTQQQIQDNMNTRLTGDESGLVGYWPLSMDTSRMESGTIDVSINSGGDAKCGHLSVGDEMTIGTTAHGVEVGIQDFSRKERNDFGREVLVKRSFSRVIEGEATLADAATLQTLADVRSTPIVWDMNNAGLSEFPELQLFGFYRDFDITEESPAFVDLTFDVRSMT